MDLKCEVGVDLVKAKKLLIAGELVAIPTETVYGLAANGFDEKAILKVFEAKNRPLFDPLIYHIAEPKQLEDLVLSIPEIFHLLMKSFWPGPLTLLFPKSPRVPDLATAGSPYVAVRMPDHALTLSLLRSLDFPLVAPSANPFTYISPTCAQHVVDQLGTKIPYVIDGGSCLLGLESTIVSWENAEKHLRIHRLGGVSFEAIQSILPSVKLVQGASGPMPGSHLVHYAPKSKLFFGSREELLVHSQRIKNRAVFLFFDRLEANLLGGQFLLADPELLKRMEGASNTSDDSLTYLKDLSSMKLETKLRNAALHLYACLRAFDQKKMEMIFVERLPEVGLGRAVNDRLFRASMK
jgi:L-threonylcarbamoyladenylate synthase